jgi:hypothetical protein
MIGRTRLQRIAGEFNLPGNSMPCRGRFVLATQRALFGSETLSLDPRELAEVVRFFDTEPGAEKPRR